MRYCTHSASTKPNYMEKPKFVQLVERRGKLVSSIAQIILLARNRLDGLTV
jgi:hypothetical protein